MIVSCPTAAFNDAFRQTCSATDREAQLRLRLGQTGTISALKEYERSCGQETRAGSCPCSRLIAGRCRAELNLLFSGFLSAPWAVCVVQKDNMMVQQPVSLHH